MTIKIPHRFRSMLFALVMSWNTALIVSGIIIYMHSESHEHYIAQWCAAFITAWPIVFVSILAIAPIVNRFLNLFVEVTEK
jgi:hypothetical protein